MSGLSNQPEFTLVTYHVPQNQMTSANPLSFPLEGTKQIYLHSHMAANTSIPLFRVEQQGPTALRWREGVTNLAGGPALYLPGATNAAITWFPQPVPPPLLPECGGVNIRDVTLTLKLSSPTGATFTHDGITFWFAIVDQPIAKRAHNEVAFSGTRTF